MAQTKNAVTYPDADNADAWIVVITADGRLYFGVTAVTPQELAEQMKSAPRYRDARLYIKSDARARFADLARVLSAARTVSFDSAVLLTSKSESPALGKLVAPKGLEVSLAPPSPGTTVVQLRDSGKPAPELTINNREIHPADLQNALNQALQNQKERIVVVDSDARLPFAQVAQAIDACTSVQAKVVLPAQE
jgi:biopolymer transport protein ExbD